MKIANQAIQMERRRSPRKGHVIEGWLSPYDSQQRTEVITFDISREGISFDAAVQVKPGDLFIYEVGFGKQSLFCDIQVVNCRPKGDGVWHVGAEFI